MANTRKQISFDLDTNALKIYYPSESWNNAYEVIRNHMTVNGFRWLQGSVYVSDKPMKPYRVTRVLDELVRKNPWLNVCMRDCRETNIGKEHDINNIFDKNAKVPTRAELKANEQGMPEPKCMEHYISEIAKERAEKGKGPSHHNRAENRDR